MALPRSKFVVCLGVATSVTLGMNQATAQAETIRGCANPAGQVRIIGATESCRAQERLVTWNSEGEQGPQGEPGLQGQPGPQGEPAPGVTGGADHSPMPTTPAPLGNGSTPTTLSTANVATGFPGYMVWANVGIEFYTGNTATGAFPSASSATCAINYSINGVPVTRPVDARSVSFPITVLGAGSNQFVRLNIGLNGMAGTDPAAPVMPSDVLDFSLNCFSNQSATPPPGTTPVKALNYSLSGIGVNTSFAP